MICPNCDADTIPPPDLEHVGSSLDDDVENILWYVKVALPSQTGWCANFGRSWTY